jgi:hypothetical protein
VDRVGLAAAFWPRFDVALGIAVAVHPMRGLRFAELSMPLHVLLRDGKRLGYVPQSAVALLQ